MTRSTAVINAALDYYHGRSWWVTPVAGKAPVLDDWPNTQLDDDAIRRSFKAKHNVGIVLGPSGLADLDFDDQVAVKALRALGPPELEGAAMFIQYFQHRHQGRVVPAHPRLVVLQRVHFDEQSRTIPQRGVPG